jgi:hypothetical protein
MYNRVAYVHPGCGLTVTGEIWVVKGIFPGFRANFRAKTGNFRLFFPVFERLGEVLSKFVFFGGKVPLRHGNGAFLRLAMFHRTGYNLKGG